MTDKQSQIRGCLLGGAVGDTLGAAVEFMGLAQIRRTYGEAGIQAPGRAYGRVGALTDDTQMTLFTAEGLLRAASRIADRGLCNHTVVVHRAYLRWLFTQGEATAEEVAAISDSRSVMSGWLVTIPELHSARAPGNTCLAALLSGRIGTPADPINNSKGCGGVMRAAPAGLLYRAGPFRMGCDVAAITHGHPSGFLSAGFLTLLIDRIVHGESLADAIDIALAELRQHEAHEEVADAVEKAVATSRNQSVSAETVESLGGGWVAEEALAIGLYCALVAEDDVRGALTLAVNHGGDSDSTGAICGNILGALHGDVAIPAEWLEVLELRDVITQIADDLHHVRPDDRDWRERYPPW